MLKSRSLLAMAGIVSALAAPIWAQLVIENKPYAGQVNLSGATLFAPFYPTLAGTNDVINVDNDFTSCGTAKAGFYDSNCPPDGTPDSVDQLATTFNCSMTTFWAVNIRGVGSGNGLAEFRDFQLCGALPTSVPPEGGWFNRTPYASGGAIVSLSPCPQGSSGTPFAQTSVDIGVMDVPTPWFVTLSGTPAWNAAPGSAGYGTYPIKSWATSGVQGGESNQLKSLCTTACGQTKCLNIDFSLQPLPTNTVYDTVVAWVPIAAIANRGTGVSQLRYSEMQYLWTTGRLPNGMNLKAATRDAGSGTRNGMMNSICVDPSWGRGDNVGKKVDLTAATKLGPASQWNNCGGSSMMEEAVINHGLAIGYTGLMGSSRAADDATRGRYEVLGVIKDRGMPVCQSGAVVRPTKVATIDNADPCTGYQIGGPETFATVGDPNANRPVGDPKKTANNPMSNPAAAAYMNNLMDSIASFAGNPGTANKDWFMPGEWLADTFLLPDGLEALPGNTAPCAFIPIANRNIPLRDYMIAYNNMGFGGDTPAYGLKCAGLVPGRVAGTYTDGTGDGRYFYKDAGGILQNVTAGKTLSSRNRLMGDFNNDGQRNIGDIPKLMEAVDKQLDFDTNNHGGCFDATGMMGDYLIVTIVGDFNGDGNFNAADVRYFADGLALQDGVLNRKQAFVDVDNAWNVLKADVNYFDTTLATCKPYAAGDARGDVAGSAVGPTPGALPQGNDGVVDIKDVEYVRANIGNWSILDQAVQMDLSADMTGDLSVDCRDVVELVEVILGTKMGDLNLDGEVNAADLATLQANIGTTAATYAAGDLDCDGDVDPADEAALRANLGFRMACLPARTEIVGRHVFYNQSYYDGNKAYIDPTAIVGANNDDADAIDPTKSPLLPGTGTATFSNWISVQKGINGLICDFRNPTRDPVISDFTFNDIGRTGAALPVAKIPSAFVVQDLGDGVKRAVVTFANASILNTWLEVAIGTGFGLAAPDVHYWGHALGDSGSGNTAPNIQVTSTDEVAARNNRVTLPNRAAVENPYDYNKDGNVTATDEVLCRNNIVPVPGNSVKMITR